MGLGGLRSHQRSSPSSASRFSVIGNDEVLVNASKICYSRTRVDRLIRSTLGNTIPKASRKEGSMNELSESREAFGHRYSWECTRDATDGGGTLAVEACEWLSSFVPAFSRSPHQCRAFVCQYFPSLASRQGPCR